MIEAGQERVLALGKDAEGKDVSITFCYIPAGKFRMGQRGKDADEEPVHEVELTRGYWLGKYPVTQRQFDCWRRTDSYQEWFVKMEETIKKTSWNDEAKSHSHGFGKHPDHPAEKITWWEAIAFGEWIQGTETSQIMEKLVESDFGMVISCRLPTEAEWEYACRAQTETEYCQGDGEAALEEVGWFAKNAGKSTMSVGELPANRWGLHDMHGNVWEWCEDAWEEQAYRFRAYESKNPWERNKDEQAYRVLRGGSWISTARGCRAAYRFGGRPGHRGRFYGFRVGLFSGPVTGRPEAAAEPAPGACARRLGSEGRANRAGGSWRSGGSEYKLF